MAAAQAVVAGAGHPERARSRRRHEGKYGMTVRGPWGGDRSPEKLDEVTRKIRAVKSDMSIFDPVLCELVYRWYSPPGGLVLDPFAGGSVRGIVASVLGRRYLGID